MANDKIIINDVARVLDASNAYITDPAIKSLLDRAVTEIERLQHNIYAMHKIQDSLNDQVTYLIESTLSLKAVDNGTPPLKVIGFHDFMKMDFSKSGPADGK